MSIRLGGMLKELRIHLCQTSPQSEGVREFIKKYYVKIKTNNPHFPILIRECSGCQPMVWARFDKGVERKVSLTDFSADKVSNTIQELAK